LPFLYRSASASAPQRYLGPFGLGALLVGEQKGGNWGMGHSGFFEPCWSFENVPRIGGRRFKIEEENEQVKKHLRKDVTHKPTTSVLTSLLRTTTCNHDDLRAKTGARSYFSPFLSFFLSFIFSFFPFLSILFF
jgi:hypothetical protein